MNPALKQEMYRIALQTFEDLGFVIPNDELTGIQAAAAIDASVRVAFRGPRSGSLTLSLYGGILPVIAANMLGQDDPPGSDEQLDALREMSNVLCGNILPRLYGHTDSFRIDPPAITDKPDPAPHITIGIDDGRAEISFSAPADS